jgi:hypothetical protein
MEFDINSLIIAITLVIIAGILYKLYLDSLNMKLSAANEQAAIKHGYYSQLGRLGNEKRWGKQSEPEPEEAPAIGAWVEELANIAGFNVDLLFQDEMPTEIQQFLPAIKGFIESGGLDRLKSQIGTQSNQNTGPQTGPDGTLYI